MIMTVEGFHKKVRELYEAIEAKGQYNFIGLRFENRVYKVGDECDWSKDNSDREDERDFPDYNSEEYAALPSMGGTSAWDMRQSAIYEFPSYMANKDISTYVLADHCYIVAGNYSNTMNVPVDYDEIVIKDAVVIKVLF